MLSFPFLWGEKKIISFLERAGTQESPRPLLRWSVCFAQDLSFSYFTHIYLSYDRF